ncbi:YutD family protein [Lactovum odontotermitis]
MPAVLEVPGLNNMAKEIAEELKNYNKYPGEQVVALPDKLVEVGKKTFRLVKNYKEGFDALALEQRYGHVFDKFDYVVGDWGHELLRLRGFYENDHEEPIEADEKIDHLADYLQEYCAYGCAYFILHRERAEGEVDEPFVADKEDLRGVRPARSAKKPHQNVSVKNRSERERRPSRKRSDDGFTTVRPDSGGNKTRNSNNNNKERNSRENKDNKKPQPKRNNRNGKSGDNKPKSSKAKFTIRERKD